MTETTPTSKKIFCVYYNTDPNLGGDNTSDNLSASGSNSQPRQPRMSSKLRDARMKWQNLRSGSVTSEGRHAETTQHTLSNASMRDIGKPESRHKFTSGATPISQPAVKPTLSFVSDRNIRTSAPDIVVNAGLTTKARSNQPQPVKPKPKQEVYQVFSQWEENQDSVSDRNLNTRTYIYDQNTMYIKKASASGPNPVLPILSEIEENLTEVDDNLNFMLSKLGVQQPATGGSRQATPVGVKRGKATQPVNTAGLHLKTLSREPSVTKHTPKTPTSALLQKALSMNIYCDYDPNEAPYGNQYAAYGSTQQSPNSQSSAHRPSLVTKALLTQTTKGEQTYVTLF